MDIIITWFIGLKFVDHVVVVCLLRSAFY